MPGREAGRLIHHPAGVFFALAALMAVCLPWLWALPLADPRAAHLRLGIYGFGGAAIAGYVLTGARAWGAGRPAVPALWLGAAVVAARTLALALPEARGLALVPLAAVGLAILWPMRTSRRPGKIGLSALPLLLALAEGAGIETRLPPEALPTGMAVLVLGVGGRIVPAFIAEERRRRGESPLRLPPWWPGPALALAGAVLPGVWSACALVAAALWSVSRLRGAAGTDPAARMLALGFLMLVPAFGILAAARLNRLAPEVTIHALTMGVMGGMIFAVSARAAMRRQEGGPLIPCARQWAGFALVLAAAVLRTVAQIAPAPWLLAAGLAWSGGWALYLAAHLPALSRPVPFPVLSGRRARE